MDAPRKCVWKLVSDVTRVGDWGTECVAAEWRDGANGPAVGARFLGHQIWQGTQWETTSTVIEAERGVSFAWAVEDPANPAATWRYQLHSAESGSTIVHYRAVMGTGSSGLTARIAKRPDHEDYLIACRLEEHKRNMMTTLHAIKRAAEEHRRAAIHHCRTTRLIRTMASLIVST
jgi:Polyketide cyclase / dehydrase and lipid transport